jgi:hypothetical protein
MPCGYFKGRVEVGMGIGSLKAPHPPPGLPLEGGGRGTAGDWEWDWEIGSLCASGQSRDFWKRRTLMVSIMTPNAAIAAISGQRTPSPAPFRNTLRSTTWK